MPLFYKVNIQPDIISLAVYERLVIKAGTDTLIGEVSREDVLPEGSTATDQNIDARSIYASSIALNRWGRVAIDGETVDPRLAGQKVVHLGTSRLFNERLFGGQRVNLGQWELADCSVYGLFVDRQGYPMPPTTVTADHANRKAVAFRAAEAMNATPAMFVFRPFEGDDFTKCSVTVRSNKLLGFASNEAEWEQLDYQFMVEPLVLPGVEVESNPIIATGGTATVKVRVVNQETDELLDANCELFLEATGGYLPQQRITVKNGIGEFRVTALGLDVGEKFKVKVGFRLMTGLADAKFEVV